MSNNVSPLGSTIDATVILQNDTNIDNDLQATKTRLNNIVASAGISNTEIVDARYSSARNETYSTLKARIDDIDTDLYQRDLNVKWYGASGSNQTTTGSILANSNSLSVTSAIDFQNGQGISVNHAGAPCTLTVPAAPTVTPTGTTGTTTYQYQIVALDANGGCTAASTTTATTTGNASLSSTNYNAISWSSVTNAFQYAVYGRVSGTIQLLAIVAGTSFNDIGASPITVPSILPATPPTSSLADSLITTISSGAGTTTLTLANNATTSASSVTVSHDDTSAINTSITNATNAGKSELFFPTGTYNDNGTINNPNNIIFVGDGVTFKSGKYSTVSTSNLNSKIGTLSNLTTTDKSSVVNAINANQNEIGSLSGLVIYLSDPKYGLKCDGVTDDSNALQNALNYVLNGQTNPLSKTVVLPTNDIRITKKIDVPVGVSLIGMANARIVADYSVWQGTDYRALHIATREGVNYNGKEYGQTFDNFQVIGKNNSTVQSIGIDFSTPSTIAAANAVNYSPILGHMSKILVSGFDTGLNIIECWNYTFREIEILNVRQAINIKGKSVNLFFDQIQATNFSKSYTSSTSNMIGVYIDSKTTYTDGEGRPEGIVFQNSLIFGADNNLSIQRGLFIRFYDCVIDGANQDCIVILDPNNLTIQGCYIYTSGAFSGINFQAIGTNDTKINIIDNYILGNAVANSYGIYNNATRFGVTIRDNFISNFPNPMFFNYLNGSMVIGNYGRSNTGVFIYCQSDCHGTFIDGNVSDDNYPILKLHTSTDKSLKIGSNTSPATVTSYQGNVSMAASTTSVNAPNGMYTSELYIRTITRVMPTGNLGNVWVNPDTNWSQATINCSAAPASATKIYYECVAVPYTATT